MQLSKHSNESFLLQSFSKQPAPEKYKVGEEQLCSAVPTRFQEMGLGSSMLFIQLCKSPAQALKAEPSLPAPFPGAEGPGSKEENKLL